MVSPSSMAIICPLETAAVKPFLLRAAEERPLSSIWWGIAPNASFTRVQSLR